MYIYDDMSSKRFKQRLNQSFITQTLDFLLLSVQTEALKCLCLNTIKIVNNT